VKTSPESLVISVMGRDQVGIVYRISKVLADLNVSIVDIDQKVTEGMFLMVVVANIADSQATLDVIRERLQREAGTLGISVAVQSEKLFKAMHRV